MITTAATTAANATDSIAADTAAGSNIVVQDSTMTNVTTKEEMQENTTIATSFLEDISANMNSIVNTAVDAVDNMNSLRVVRLEQNRKAASESRKRKRILLDELHRSEIFFTRANDTLKQQNQNLQKLLQQAQNQIQNDDKNNNERTNGSDESKPTTSTDMNPSKQSSHENGDDSKKKKVYLPIIIPPAQVPLQMSNFLNTVETGATIQAMTNFQQAASAAMKAALLHMQEQCNNGEMDYTGSVSGIQQQHQSLFEIATLTVPTTTTKVPPTGAVAQSSTITEASTNANKSEP